MQHPQKSCSQCRSRKIKCDLRLPRCSSCHTRGLVCQFGLRRRPGPSKGSKKQKQNSSRNDSHGSGDGGTSQSSHFDEPHFLLPDTRRSGHGSVLDEDALESKTTLDILPMLEEQLIEAYLAMRLFPFFPPIRKQHLLDPNLNGTLRSALVNALCAVSAHSASGNIFELLPTTRIQTAKLFASRAKSAYLRYTREEDHPTTLTAIKVAAILAVYDMFCSPGIKGWSMVGEAIRLACDMRLDQLDSKCHLTSAFMSAEAAEDARYVWWCIYALDGHASSTLMRPFAIANDTINTALVSTHEDQFKKGNISPMQGLFLPSDPVELQVTALSLNHCDPTSTQTLYLLILSLGRLVANLRREQLDGRDVDVRSNLIQNTYASMRLSIPDNFLQLKDGSDDKNLRLTRTEIMLLLELLNLCLHSYPSPDTFLQESDSLGEVLEPLGQASFPGSFGGNPTVSSHGREWNACVHSAFQIVRIARSLSSRDCSRISPTMASVFWLPAMTLVLYQRSRTTAAERSIGASGTQVLKAALKRIGNTWAVAQRFHEALTALHADPATACSEFHMRCALETYTSPLLSVSHRENTVHIPSLVVFYFDQYQDSSSCAL